MTTSEPAVPNRRIAMRVALVLITVPGALLALARAAGSLVPANREHTETVYINAPVDEVFDTLADFDSIHEWGPEFTALEAEGPRQWRQSLPKQTVRWTLSEQSSGHRLVVTETVSPPLRGSTQTWTIGPSAMGAEVSVTVQTWVASPVRRLGRLVFSTAESRTALHLDALKQHLEGSEPPA